MQSILTTALMGVFLLSGSGSSDALSRLSDMASGTPSSPIYTVSMTGYNAVPGQTDNNPFDTASGVYADADLVAARSSDLADKLPFGTVIQLVPTDASSTPGCERSLVEPLIGLRVIADAMHPRKRNQIDILFHSDSAVKIAAGKRMNPARALGMCKDVEIQVVGHIDVSKMPQSQVQLAEMLMANSRVQNSPLALSH